LISKIENIIKNIRFSVIAFSSIWFRLLRPCQISIFSVLALRTQTLPQSIPKCNNNSKCTFEYSRQKPCILYQLISVVLSSQNFEYCLSFKNLSIIKGSIRSQFQQLFTWVFFIQNFGAKNYKAVFWVWNFLAPKYLLKMPT